MLGTTSEAGTRAEERLRSEEVARRATVRPDGQPQSVPVWFLWDGEGFLVYSRPGARKLRNIEANPKINLNLNSNANGGDVVRAECVAEVLADRDGDPSVCQGSRRRGVCSCRPEVGPEVSGPAWPPDPACPSPAGQRDHDIELRPINKGEVPR